MAISGVDGACKLNTTTWSVTAWTYDGTIETQEVTTVGSTDKAYAQTTRDGSGSITVVGDASDASQKVAIDYLLSSNTPGKVLLQLYQDSTGTDQLYFSAVIVGISLPMNVNDVQIWTIDYKKTGDLYHVPTT